MQLLGYPHLWKPSVTNPVITSVITGRTWTHFTSTEPRAPAPWKIPSTGLVSQACSINLDGQRSGWRIWGFHVLMGDAIVLYFYHMILSFTILARDPKLEEKLYWHQLHLLTRSYQKLIQGPLRISDKIAKNDLLDSRYSYKIFVREFPKSIPQELTQHR